MPKITYIEHSGKSYVVEVPNELSVMEGAVQNNIPGITADCGGACACATCHVYVDEKWFDKLKKKMKQNRICLIWLLSQINLVDWVVKFQYPIN